MDNQIIIGNQSDSVYYKPILKELLLRDECTLHWHPKNDANAEYVIRLLKEGAGLVEVSGSRETIKTENTVCKFRDPNTGMCTNQRVKPSIKCTEQVRRECKHYNQKYTSPLTVNAVVLEKVAQAKR